MTKTILSLCLAAVGFAGLLPASASAHEVTVPVTAETAALGLPSTVRVNQTVVIDTGSRHRRGYSRYHRNSGRYYGRSHRHGGRYHVRHGRRYYY